LASLVKAYSFAMRATMMPALVLLVGLGWGAASCATAGGAPGGLELGLKRGAGWSTLLVRPPRVTGPNAMLELKRGRLVGTFQNRPISVDIKPDGLSGQIAGGGAGEAGTVEVDITGGPDDLEVAGLWLGQRVHLTITPESLRGTISGPAAGHCQFVLDRVDKTGGRAGTSICWGLPEPTVLDLPAALPQVLERAQIVALVLVLLSSPPITHGEAARPLAR
jgi:hypothetical protein